MAFWLQNVILFCHFLSACSNCLHFLIICSSAPGLLSMSAWAPGWSTWLKTNCRCTWTVWQSSSLCRTHVLSACPCVCPSCTAWLKPWRSPTQHKTAGPPCALPPKRSITSYLMIYRYVLAIWEMFYNQTCWLRTQHSASSVAVQSYFCRFVGWWGGPVWSHLFMSVWNERLWDRPHSQSHWGII